MRFWTGGPAQEANLQPPVLMELFDRLRKKGYSLELPANLDDAEAQLERFCLLIEEI